MLRKRRRFCFLFSKKKKRILYSTHPFAKLKANLDMPQESIVNDSKGQSINDVENYIYSKLVEKILLNKDQNINKNIFHFSMIKFWTEKLKNNRSREVSLLAIADIVCETRLIKNWMSCQQLGVVAPY